MIYFYLAFGLSVRGTIRGNTLTVDYNTTEEAMCTCQLDSNTPVSCKILYTISQIMGNFIYQVILGTCSLISHWETTL